MEHDIQKANIWKRISAGIFDFIVTGILAVGIALVLSWLLGYNTYAQRVDEAYAHYGQLYGVDFSIGQEAYLALTPEQLQTYEEAAAAMNRDDAAVHAYTMMMNLALVITSIAILVGVLLMEFLIPLLLKNGQTLGKKVFGLCLIRTDAVQINTMQLFTRTILGKYVFETMVPVYIILNILLGNMGMIGTGVLLALAAVQLGLLVFNRNHGLIHDLLAGTVAVDLHSQRIFTTTDDLIAYQKKIAAERAARQEY